MFFFDFGGCLYAKPAAYGVFFQSPVYPIVSFTVFPDFGPVLLNK